MKHKPIENEAGGEDRVINEHESFDNEMRQERPWLPIFRHDTAV